MAFFGPPAQLLPSFVSPASVTSDYDPVEGKVYVRINFDDDMDTSVKPSGSVFETEFSGGGGAPATPESEWNGNRQLMLISEPWWSKPDTVDIELPAVNANFKSATGDLVAPFAETGVSVT